MRRHTNGGYQNVVDELWRQCEAWNANIIIMYQNVACKNMATVQGILDEQGREQGLSPDLDRARSDGSPHRSPARPCATRSTSICAR